jgi:formylglycine-generating enzyme required for sulfatase activity/uncharacterized caspase-like protein
MSKNWAICIGINKYKFVSKLRFAQRDAQKMSEFCDRTLNFEKVYYFAEDTSAIELDDGRSMEALPTFGNLMYFLDWRFKKAFLQPQDNLWFFFAGHGRRSPDGIDYLMPIDGNPDQLERTGLVIHDVAEQLRSCGAGNIVLMLDACRNGKRNSRDIDLGIGIEPHQGVVTLFSCGAHEKSYEIEALEHGVFTYALLEALQLGGPENCATVDRLSHRLRHRVGELNREHQIPVQTPLVRAEPIDKLHLVLLPDKATLHDAAPLKNDALKAEAMRDLAFARQLWIRVLAVIRADVDAIEALERIAVQRAELTLTARTLGIGGERTGSISQENEIVEAEAKAPQIKKAKPALPVFSFEVKTADKAGNVVGTKTQQAEYRREDLGNKISLDLMMIPGGTFQMGSPNGQGYDSERPQHKVTVKPFLMGKHPVTQAQWKAVASLPKAASELKAKPSNFEGDSRPVDQVSWNDAVEFCKRLSKHTGREYRLPSEAEWEYACRAGTTTAFHFGEALTSELANYDATETYGDGPKGQYREQTTEVGIFPANAFGLYDMHGNVWEWCQDHRHENYAGAPTNGSAWLLDDENAVRLLRGGSWHDFPDDCRSANRYRSARGFRNDLFGFRVVCASSWTLK